MTTDAVPATGRLLAVDLGDVRIGLALSDAAQVVATPLDTLLVADVVGAPLSSHGRGAEAGTATATLDALADAIGAIAQDHDVAGVVVGYPRTLGGREGAAAGRARRLGERIRERTGRPVALWDERLTSVEAERTMLEQGASRAERRAAADRVAATLILQGYLESRRAGADRPLRTGEENG